MPSLKPVLPHHTTTSNWKGTQRVQISPVDSSITCKSATPTTLYVWMCFPWSHHISTLALFCFVITELFYDLLDAKIYGIVEHRSLQGRMPHLATLAKGNFMEPPHDSALLQNLMGLFMTHATPFHHVSWKSVW